ATPSASMPPGRSAVMRGDGVRRRPARLGTAGGLPWPACVSSWAGSAGFSGVSFITWCYRGRAVKVANLSDLFCVLRGRFVWLYATPFNMAVLWEYLEKNGRMVDVYTDRDSMFQVAPRAGENEQE